MAFTAQTSLHLYETAQIIHLTPTNHFKCLSLNLSKKYPCRYIVVLTQIPRKPFQCQLISSEA